MGPRAGFLTGLALFAWLTVGCSIIRAAEDAIQGR
jgi:hypothetical protein